MRDLQKPEKGFGGRTKIILEKNMKTLKALSLRIDKCASEIDSMNRRNFVIFSDGGLILASAILVLSIFLPSYRNWILPHGMLFLYMLAVFFIARDCQRRENKYIRPILYLTLTPMLIWAVLAGTYLDPNSPAITIIIFLCILPLFIIDKPWRIILFQVAFAAAFVLCSHGLKPEAVFQTDVFYLPLYLGLGIGANLFSLMGKVESAENMVRLRFESERDSLTKLFNRKTGEEKVRSLLENKVPGTFAIMDVDNFKHFNDEYGHQVGDDVLCTVAGEIQKVFRRTDVIWRMGGDEFIIYAINMLDEDTCRSRFEKLMKNLEALALPAVGIVGVRISVGCVICNNGQMQYEKIFKASDDALYAAKNAGKDRIMMGK